ncbi:putative Cyclic nucleotide-binding ion channel protein [Diplonema papillatum]|nr:putative Cyclic nucleotide-binding ion channel protein [Diplonema papillatum]
MADRNGNDVQELLDLLLHHRLPEGITKVHVQSWAVLKVKMWVTENANTLEQGDAASSASQLSLSPSTSQRRQLASVPSRRGAPQDSRNASVISTPEGNLSLSVYDKLCRSFRKIEGRNVDAGATLSNNWSRAKALSMSSRGSRSNPASDAEAVDLSSAAPFTTTETEFPSSPAGSCSSPNNSPLLRKSTRVTTGLSFSIPTGVPILPTGSSSLQINNNPPQELAPRPLPKEVALNSEGDGGDDKIDNRPNPDSRQSLPKSKENVGSDCNKINVSVCQPDEANGNDESCLPILDAERPAEFFLAKQIAPLTEAQFMDTKRRDVKLNVYDMSTLLVLYPICFWNIITVPLGIAFIEVNPFSLCVFFDFLTILVLVQKVWIPFELKGHFVTEIRVIARRYLSGSFWFDLLMCTPLYLFTKDNYTIWRVNRLLIAYYIPGLTSYLAERFLPSLHPLWTRLFRLLLIFMLTIHVTTCGTHLIISQNDDKGSAWMRNDLMPSSSVLHQYLLLSDWSTRQLLGRGTFIPVYDNQVLWSVVVVSGGFIMLTLLLATANDSFASLDVAQSVLPTKLDHVRDQLAHMGLPASFRDETVYYYRAMWATCKTFSIEDQDRIFDDLPEQLYYAIQHAVNAGLISKIPLFSRVSENTAFIWQMMASLTPVICVPGQPVVERGSAGDMMYFVLRGVLEVLDENGLAIATITEGSCFGESTLLFGGVRTHSIVSVEYTRLYGLHRTDFERLVDDFPEALFQILEEVVARIDGRASAAAPGEEVPTEQLAGRPTHFDNLCVEGENQTCSRSHVTEGADGSHKERRGSDDSIKSAYRGLYGLFDKNRRTKQDETHAAQHREICDSILRKTSFTSLKMGEKEAAGGHRSFSPRVSVAGIRNSVFSSRTSIFGSIAPLHAGANNPLNHRVSRQVKSRKSFTGRLSKSAASDLKSSLHSPLVRRSASTFDSELRRSSKERDRRRRGDESSKDTDSTCASFSIVKRTSSLNSCVNAAKEKHGKSADQRDNHSVDPNYCLKRPSIAIHMPGDDAFSAYSLDDREKSSRASTTLSPSQNMTPSEFLLQPCDRNLGSPTLVVDTPT